MSDPQPEAGFITTVDQDLKRLGERVDQPVPRRPLWKRIALPMVGLVMIIVGLAFLFTPIPLAILIIFGFPLLFCFHPRIEQRARDWMVGRLELLRVWVRSWKRSRHHP